MWRDVNDDSVGMVGIVEKLSMVALPSYGSCVTRIPVRVPLAGSEETRAPKKTASTLACVFVQSESSFDNQHETHFRGGGWHRARRSVPRYSTFEFQVVLSSEASKVVFSRAEILEQSSFPHGKSSAAIVGLVAQCK